MTSQEQFDELTLYTLAHPSSDFLHQLAVDAYTAQTASETTKTIAIFFALMGLYLAVEKGWTGRRVQLAHIQLAPKKSQLPRPLLPADRGPISVADVLRAAPGDLRDRAIHAWCASVWQAFCTHQPTSRMVVASFLKSTLDID